LAQKTSLSWQSLANEPIIILARREGASSHDAILAACQQAKFTPRLAHTPSLIGTILQYVEAGAGIGIVPESTIRSSPTMKLVPLTPRHSIPLVMVWKEGELDPAALGFRDLTKRWLKDKRL
jgi:DNA-binding transcriptional LysR family regulator